MSAATVSFSVPCHVLGRDPAEFLKPEVGPTWPQEQHEVTLHDLKVELEHPETAASPMDQLDTRGFAVFKSNSEALGPLAEQKQWNAAYLEVSQSYCKP